MSRLPYLRRQELDEQAAALWDTITASRPGSLVNAEGGLMGPFNAWLHAPEVGRRLADLGSHLRFGTSIERRLLELAIVTVGAHWHAEFEWWAHAAMARRHGVSEDILEALAAGRPPEFTAGDERTVHSVAYELVTTGGLSQPTFAAGRALLGDAGMVELISLCGYYALVSFTLNSFAVPLPEGVPPVWAAHGGDEAP